MTHQDQVTSIFIPTSSLLPSPTNPRKRFDEEKIRGMADTMATVGVLQPLVVRNFKGKKGKYEIVAGETRWRAAKVAGLDQVPVIVRELTDQQVIKIQVIENAQRNDLHPLEEAFGFKAWLDQSQDLAGYTIDDLAREVGKSKRTIYASLQLCNLCDGARNAFYEGLINSSTALLIARIPGQTLQMKAVEEISKPGWGGEPMSFRSAQEHIKRRFTLELKKAPWNQGDSGLITEAGSCKACPKRSGNARDVFPDIESADVCTDPECFEKKRSAHISILQKTTTVLEGNEALKIMPKWWDVNEDYTLVDRNAPGHNESLEQLLDGSAHIITIVHPEDKEIYRVIKKSDAAEALAAKGLKINFPKVVSQSQRDKDQERETRIENAYRVRLLEKVSGVISPELEKDWRLEDFEQTIVATAMLDRLDHETSKRMLKLRSITFSTVEGPYQAIKDLRESIKTMSSAQRMLLLLQMALISQCYVNQYTNNPAEDLLFIASQKSINSDEIRKSVEAEFAPKSKTKATGSSLPQLLLRKRRNQTRRKNMLILLPSWPENFLRTRPRLSSLLRRPKKQPLRNRLKPSSRK